MKALISFRKEDLESDDYKTGLKLCPTSQDLREMLTVFHSDLLRHANHPLSDDEDEGADAEVKAIAWTERLLALISSNDEKGNDAPSEDPIGNYA